MSAVPQLERVQFAGHETFPLRQLWLRKVYTAMTEAGATEKKAIDPKLVFDPETGIRKFGVGKNMVAAMRHWALACDVLKEERGSKNALALGPVGHVLMGKGGLDPYLERSATAWLVHWLLAGRAERSTTWWWVFNRVSAQVFDADSVAQALLSAAHQRGWRASPVTIKRDVEVCLRCYLPRHDGREADDAAEPLLADLGLLSELHSGGFLFRRGTQASLPDGVFGYALVDFWQSRSRLFGSAQATLSFETIAHEYGAPGRVFKLDERSVSERLTNLEGVTQGQMAWSDSAGIRQISQKLRQTPDDLKNSLLRHAYGR